MQAVVHAGSAKLEDTVADSACLATYLRRITMFFNLIIHENDDQATAITKGALLREKSAPVLPPGNASVLATCARVAQI